MTTIFKFELRYFILVIILFAVETCIAIFVHDTIIRPYIGDVLVVILIYCFVKSFFNTPVVPTAIGVLVFSFAVEAAQYFHVINLLGLQRSRLATVILGSSFSWMDMVPNIIGITTVIIAEKIFPLKPSAAHKNQ